MSSTGNNIEPKMAHVNLMIDTVIANLSEDDIRSVLRSMLATDPSITSVFENRTRSHLRRTANVVSTETETSLLHTSSGLEASSSLVKTQKLIRALLGCGMCYESVPLITDIVSRIPPTELTGRPKISAILSTIDGDIIQVLTAVQKTLSMDTGVRRFSTGEQSIMEQLSNALHFRQPFWTDLGHPYPFERSLKAIISMLPSRSLIPSPSTPHLTISPLTHAVETFSLGSKTLPRLFTGLWQLSSPSWGTAPLASIMEQFSAYASSGFIAYDMADHYGDAEILFGQFRSSLTNPSALFGATKYCIFNTPTSVSRDLVEANVTERCRRMASTHLDLLQFHWQDYSHEGYISALKYLSDDSRVHNLGLCNFDTKHMQNTLGESIPIVSNQVQFSLIDARPMYKMGPLCQQHNIKLLTYGTLCGGFLSGKWLDKPEPLEVFGEGITPSQRKYYEMILNWGGWELFQELLCVLNKISERHGVGIGNVATRWVLDHPYVGAVIVGTRMGVSDKREESVKTYGWKLDEDDNERIELVLRRSNRDSMIEVLGDCGGEYR